MEKVVLNVLIFLAGVCEDYISGLSTRFVADGRPIGAGLVSTVYTVLVFWVIVQAVSNASNLWMVFWYALGSGIGTYFSVKHYSRFLKKKRKKGARKVKEIV